MIDIRFMHLTNTLRGDTEQTIVWVAYVFEQNGTSRLVSVRRAWKVIRPSYLRELLGGLNISTQTARDLAPFHDPYHEETNETGLSELAAKVLLALNEAYPGTKDAAESAETDLDRTLMGQLWSNLIAQGIVGGPIHQGVLSKTGQEALEGALAAIVTSTGQRALTGEAASLFLLGIMRRHFWQEVKAS